MGAHHHRHSHDRGASRRRLWLTLGLTLTYMGAEVVGGLWTGSLALLADAGHMLSDAAALGLSIFAAHLAARPATNERTFGYHRTEILAALANGAALLVIAALICVEALERLREPAQVSGLPMLLIASGGLLMNLFAMGLLHPHKDDSLNVRGAFLHVLADALGSLGAIIAGLLIWGLGWHWADAAASLLITALVVYSAWALVRDAIGVLMEGTPEDVDVDALRNQLQAMPSVLEVHDLHVWLITSGMPSASVHLVTDPQSDRDAALHAARDLLRERFGISHSTIQVEGGGGPPSARCSDCPAQ